MKRIVWIFILIVFSASQLRAAKPEERERYVEVEAGDVVKSPQSFWLIGIVFNDTIATLPSGRIVKVDKKRYGEITTETVGKCYVDLDLIPTLEEAEPGQDYIFTGTVISMPSSFFGGGGGYQVVVHKAVPSIAASDEEAGDIFSSLVDDEAIIEGQPLEEMMAILTRTKANLVGYVLENDLDLVEVFNDDTEHAAAIRDIVRQIIRSEENERKTSSTEILTRFVYTLIEQDALGSGTESESEEEQLDEEVVAEPEKKPLSKKELKRLEKERKKAQKASDEARREEEKRLERKQKRAEAIAREEAEKRQKEEARRLKEEKKVTDKPEKSGKRRFFGILPPKKTPEEVAEEQRLEEAERKAKEEAEKAKKAEKTRKKDEVRKREAEEKARKALQEAEPEEEADLYAPIGR